MLRRFFHSHYVKNCIVLIAAGAAIIILSNMFKNAHITAGIAKVNDVLVPVYIGAFFAFLLCPLFNKLVRYFFGIISMRHGSYKENLAEIRSSEEETKRFRHNLFFAKFFASFICMIVIVVAIGLVAYFVMPQVIASVVGLFDNMPERLRSLSEWTSVHLANFPQISETLNEVANAGMTKMLNWAQENLLQQDVTTVATLVSQQVMEFLNALFDIFVGILISIYLLNYKEQLFAIGRKVVAGICSEKKQNEIFEFFRIINETFIGFIVGRILDAIVIGILTYIVLIIFKIPLPLLISVIVGVTNVIPFFGPFLGAIPSFCIIFLESPIKAVYFAVLILIIQQLDGNVIGPKIVGNVIGISSFWVLISVLIGGGLFGFLGMALGVPVFCVIYHYLSHFTGIRLASRKMTNETMAYMDYEPYGIQSEPLKYHEEEDSNDSL